MKFSKYLSEQQRAALKGALVPSKLISIFLLGLWELEALFEARCVVGVAMSNPTEVSPSSPLIR